MRLLLIIAILLLAGAFAALQLFFGVFAALSYEAPVAKVSVAAVGDMEGRLMDDRFVLGVEFANGLYNEYYVAGDYFLMEAEVVTLKEWAAILGGAPRVMLTRLSGQFDDEFVSSPRLCSEEGAFYDSAPCISQYSLRDDQYVLQFKGPDSLVARFGDWFLKTAPAERMKFRSGAGADLSDGAVIWICMTEDALVARDARAGCADDN